MKRVPFKKFIINLLLCGKSINEIVDKVKSFGYYITQQAVLEIFDGLRSVLPENIKDIINNKELLSLENESHIQWLNYFDVFDIYDYTIRNKKNIADPPEYFKWCRDCLWVHSYKDVMSLINIFIFNNEPLESVSDIIMFKYSKKIGIDAFNLYKRIFWDIENLSAKEAIEHCVPLQNNSLIVRQFKTGGSEIETGLSSAATDGCDVPFNFHDSNYIKWKIGYKQVSVPNTKDFLEKIQLDCMYKYYEAMNMVQSIETEEESGTNDLGAFENLKTKKRNVEEQRVKLARQWLDMYLKSKESMPKDGGGSDKSFFEKMRELELEFDNCTEKIVSIDDHPDIKSDIAGDMTKR